MRKTLCVVLSIVIIALACACTKKGDTDNTVTNDSNQNKETGSIFTDLIKTEDGVSFCLPASRSGNTFNDNGANCMVTWDRYSYDVAAYHEFDDQGQIEKKTVGKYTYDYQKFNNYGIENWIVYVIRIAFTESTNQMAHSYYKIVYNVYANSYDDSQVEKFMSTIQFEDYVVNYR